jgi:Heterokaryon incompatibility protein (HET)
MYKALSYTWAVDTSHRKQVTRGLLYLPLLPPLVLLHFLARKFASKSAGISDKWARWIEKLGGGIPEHQKTANHEHNIHAVAAREPETENIPDIAEEVLLPIENSHEGPPVHSQISREYVLFHGGNDNRKNSMTDLSKGENQGVTEKAQVMQPEWTHQDTKLDNVSSQPPAIPMKMQDSGEASHMPPDDTSSVFEPDDTESRGPRARWLLLNKSSDRVILCNGKQLRIGMNLYSALRETPSREGQLWWIDAICIDQTNMSERGQQVDMMAQIYGNAQEVIVWLGRSSTFTNKAASFLASLPSYTLGNHYLPDADHKEVLSQSSHRETMLKDPSDTIRRYRTKWLALLLILHRRWFNRVWVLQEAMLAKEISFHLGKYVISEDILINGLQWFEHLVSRQKMSPFPWLSNPLVHSMIRPLQNSLYTLQMRTRFREGERWQLEDYLHAARGREATNPRDLAFARFSLVNLGEKENVSPNLLKEDYTKSTAQVFRECAEWLLQRRSGLRVLSLVGDTREPTESQWRQQLKIPSWVPNLARPLRPVPLWSLGGDTFSAFQQNRKRGTYTLDGSILNLQSIRWDIIEVVGESSTEVALDPMGLIRILSSLGPQYTPTGEATMTALWRTYLANLYKGKHPAPPFLSSSFLRWAIFVLFPSVGDTSLEGSKGLSDIQLKTRDIFELHHSGEFNFKQAIEDISFDEPPTASKDLPYSQARAPTSDEASGNRDTQQVYESPRWEELEGINSTALPASDFTGGLSQGISVAFRDAFDSKLGLVLEILEPFGTSWEANYSGKRIFLTAKGYLGTGPASTHEGDTVMLIDGSYVPYIFRDAENADTHSIHSRRREGVPSDTVEAKVQSLGNGTKTDAESENHGNETQWRLVGEAYVHGIMHGEALLDETQSVTTIHVI